MTAIAFSNGRVVVRDGKVGTAGSCCCGPGGPGGPGGTGDCTPCADCNNITSISDAAPFTGCPGGSFFFPLWFRQRQVYSGSAAPSALQSQTAAGWFSWQWNEGYPGKLLQCNLRWVDDATFTRCCPSGALRTERRRWSIVAVDCATGRTRDITADATTGLFGAVHTINYAASGSPCGSEPGFFPGPGNQLVPCKCFRESANCTPNRYKRAVVTLSHSFSYNNETRQDCIVHYDAWREIFEDRMTGTFTLEPDPLDPTLFQHIDQSLGGPIQVCGVNNFTQDVVRVTLRVNQPSLDAFTPNCDGVLVSVGADTTLQADIENCYIQFDRGGGPRYFTIPGGCFQNFTDCRTNAGYHAASFVTGIIDATPLQFDYCAPGPKTFTLQTRAPLVFPSPDCLAFSVVTTITVTLQDE